MSNNRERRAQAMDALNKELKARDRSEKTQPLGVVFAALAVLVIICGGIWFAATRDSSGNNEQDTAAAESTAPDAATVLDGKPSQALPETVSCEYTPSGDAGSADLPNGTDVPTTGTVSIDFATNQGDIPVTLNRAAAPCAANAIEHLAKTGFYDGKTCHRLTTNGIYVLQCGSPNGDGVGGPGFSYSDEYPVGDAGITSPQVTYPRGSIALANSGPNTNGSQFFLNYKDSPLAPNYTYVGTISDEGLKVIDKVAKAGVQPGSGNGQGATDGTPIESVTINSASVK